VRMRFLLVVRSKMLTVGLPHVLADFEEQGNLPSRQLDGPG